MFLLPLPGSANKEPPTDYIVHSWFRIGVKRTMEVRRILVKQVVDATSDAHRVPIEGTHQIGVDNRLCDRVGSCRRRSPEVIRLTYLTEDQVCVPG